MKDSWKVKLAYFHKYSNRNKSIKKNTTELSNFSAKFSEQ